MSPDRRDGGSGDVDRTAAFEVEKTRLLRIAARVLGDPHEAQDVVQNAWIRMDSSRDDIGNLPAWLTTVTTRLCLDRLRLRVPLPTVSSDVDDVEGKPVHVEGGQQVAQFFNGAARAAMPVSIGNRPGAAWFHRGDAKVAFEFTIDQGMVQRITFRAEESLLVKVRRRGIQRQD